MHVCPTAHIEHCYFSQLYPRSSFSGVPRACRSRETVRHRIGVWKYASLSPLQCERHELDNYEFDPVFRGAPSLLTIASLSENSPTEFVDTHRRTFVQSFPGHCTFAMSHEMILSLASWRNIKGVEGRKRGHSRQRCLCVGEKTNTKWRMRSAICLRVWKKRQ